MKLGVFIRGNRYFAGVAAFFLVVALALSIWTGGIVWRVIKFHRQNGPDWVQVYEQYHGPMSYTVKRIAVGAGSSVSIVLVLGWFYRYTLNRRNAAKKIRRIRKNPGQDTDRIARPQGSTTVR